MRNAAPEAHEEILGQQCSSAPVRADELIGSPNCHHDGVDVGYRAGIHNVAAESGHVAHLQQYPISCNSGHIRGSYFQLA